MFYQYFQYYLFEPSNSKNNILILKFNEIHNLIEMLQCSKFTFDIIMLEELNNVTNNNHCLIMSNGSRVWTLENG